MDVDFFLRYSLQRMCGTFGENEFDSKELLCVGQDYIDEFIAECDRYCETETAKLADKYDTSYLSGKRVLFIGDSLTQDRVGYRPIVTKTADITAKSVAISGATSTDMLRLAYEAIRGFKPDIVSLMIGTNDAYIYGGQIKKSLVSTEEYRQNIAGIISDAKASGAAVIVSAIPPMDERKYSDMHNVAVKSNSNANIAGYNNIVRIEAADVMLVDLENAVKSASGEMIEPDGIHLNRAGQLVLADLWIKTITGGEKR